MDNTSGTSVNVIEHQNENAASSDSAQWLSKNENLHFWVQTSVCVSAQAKLLVHTQLRIQILK